MTALVQVAIGPQIVPVWPQDQAIYDLGGKAILRTEFQDTAAYHEGLIAHLLELESDPAFSQAYSKSIGGRKINFIDRWERPEAQLVHARAMAFFRLTRGSETAVTDMSWANIYRAGAYSSPHSHPRSTASVVYCLDPGEPAEDDPLSGAFCVVDPRYQPCCQVSEHFLTNPLMPKMTAGTMLIFPGRLPP